MLGYVDMAFHAFMETLFDPIDNFVTAWGHPDQSRQKIAEKAEKMKLDAVGIRGMSVFRTGEIRDPKRFNQANASKGIPSGRRTDINDNLTNWVNIIEIPVNAEYTCVAWAKAWSEVCVFQKRLEFADIYKKIRFTIPVEDKDPIPCSFHFYGLPAITKIQSTPTTGNEEWYRIDKKFIVDAKWFMTKDDKFVKEIVIDFQNGATLESLDNIKITEDGIAKYDP